MAGPRRRSTGTAIATTLGLEAADVRSAFEAARPKKPAAATTTAP